MRFFSTLSLVLVMISARPADGQPVPRQVFDLAPGETRIWPLPTAAQIDAAVLGEMVYFAAEAPGLGRELWASDGTSAGTRLVRDLCPGPCGASPNSLTVFDDRLFFLADDGVFGTELWTSDGTEDGTRLVADICFGPCAGLENGWLAAGAGHLFFSARDDLRGQNLWSSDGRTVERLGDFCPGPCDIYPAPPIVAGGQVFVTLTNVEGQRSLARSDGTRGGTRVLLEGVIPDPGAALGELLIFPHTGPADGIEPWVSDGTVAGTRPVADLCPGACSGWASIEPVGTFDHRVWFGGRSEPGAPDAIWATDGTVEGTRPVVVGMRPFGSAARFGDEVWLSAAGALGADLPCTGLWAISLAAPPDDGSEALARAVLCDQIPEEIIVAGERLFITLPLDLLVDDGAGGLRQAAVFDAHYGPGATGLIPFGNRVIFNGLDRIRGAEPWISDGTSEGTRPLGEIGRGPASSAPDQLTTLSRGGQDTLVFTTSNQATDPGVWVSDGRPAGTFRLPGPAEPHELTVLRQTLYYSARYRGDVRGLWRSRGSVETTELLDEDVTRVEGIHGHARKFFFQGTSARSTGGAEPWLSDGTPEGTRQLADLYPGTFPFGPPEPLSSEPADFTRTGGITYFSAENAQGRELWRTNGRGEAPFTRRVFDICPGECDSDPRDLLSFHNALLFSATDGVHGRELWRTGDVRGATRLIVDLLPGPAGSNPHSLHRGIGPDVLADDVFFFARRAPRRESLWRMNDTDESLVEIASLGRGAFVTQTLQVGSRLYFVVAKPAQGTELWKTDGTTATRLHRFIPGPRGGDPLLLGSHGTALLFAATDREHGRELWMSRGSQSATRRITDLVPGPGSSSPTSLTVNQDGIFFTASDGVGGHELWALDLSALR